MPLQIVLAWNGDCEKELLEKGFTKREIYVKEFSTGETSDVDCEKGDSDIFKMRHKPYQFKTTSYWGAVYD